MIHKKNYSDLPSLCGVYYFLQKGKPIYIGKAINIKARIYSHIKNAEYDAKEKLIIENSDQIKFDILENEFKALVFEAKMIQKYNPKYNLILKDNRSFLYIKITIKDKYPKVFIVRKEQDDKSIYFGPFKSSHIVQTLIRSIRKIIPFCTQKNISKNKCFYSKINLCNPCPNDIEKKYQINVNEAKKLHSIYKKNIKKIIKLLSGNTDFILKNLQREINLKNKTQSFEENIKIREKINIFNNLLIHQDFSDELLFKNDNFTDVLNEYNDFMLDIFNVPNKSNNFKIECFDISNFSGKEATASMVVFENNFPKKEEYKRFKIKHVKQISDIFMMKEVLERRFLNTKIPLPDLLLIDGGTPQIKTANEVLKKLNIKIPLCGIAKNPDRLISNDFKTINLNRRKSFFNLVRYIRDESHRFAKKYHLYLRNKKQFLI